jgi:hypothetical protein
MTQTQTSPSAKTPPVERKFGSLRDATAISGISRTQLYKYAVKYPGLFRKNGTATLVDLGILNKVLDDLPVG